MSFTLREMLGSRSARAHPGAVVQGGLAELRAQPVRRDHAALGDDAGDEPGRRDIECRVGHRGGRLRQPQLRGPAVWAGCDRVRSFD